ncbi:CDP-diacylglycerol--glycerol-3-phosphate 3-phosphatidyltransferase [Catenovulum maritimum]|uniref:CDP-diacylglycerol--glycerol-3-phosphate 3-phosphatidyltransferase n=1 Tax=Catenovulum maritimum TaxID=1513271 RepID=A0A0J8GMB7_9ALTE|nr:CDP-diacylglycerol--glycerol-3-phosphate 3-phosphatidyltransferase [Catenovulum maritimum]KMT63920.1 CDP-diacylglycerol--glycerol-3-phosphate 3-phosphatidyltransferase [Catenovulum maritimum]
MWNIPNLLTAFRIVLIPFFVLCFYLPVPWAYIAAASIFAVAGATDWLDGYLARKWQQQTKFGAFLDPVADKLMVATALGLIVEHYNVFWITLPAVVMVCREILISALREWMAELGKRAAVNVSEIGKWKTFAQMLAIFGLLFNLDGLTLTIFTGFLYVAVILTFWSMVIYLKAAWPEFKKA